MVDIADAAQKSQDSPLLKEEAVLPPPAPPPASPPPSDDIMNAVLDAATPGEKTNATTTPPSSIVEPQELSAPPASTTPPPQRKSRRTGAVVAVVLFLLFALPLTVYFISQQQQLAEIRSRALVGPYPSQTPGASQTPGPSGTPTGNCNDCGGFNQGQCGVGGSDTINCNPNNAPCEGGMKVCDGGCYPDGYHSCKAQGRGGCYPPQTSCDRSDPCDGVSCPTGQYCNGGACVTGQGGDNIVSFICSQCTADRRCDTGGSVGTHGYSNPCGQVDSCDKNPDGSINFNTCRAIKLCDPSCSGGGTTPTPGGHTPTPTRPPGGHTPTPTSPPPGGQCETIRVYDESDTDITPALRSGARTLSVGETVTLATPKTSATKARFRIQGVTQFEENDPSLTANDEYRLTIQIPSTITQAQGSFEVEVFLNGNWK